MKNQLKSKFGVFPELSFENRRDCEHPKTTISYGNTATIHYQIPNPILTSSGQSRAETWYTDSVATEMNATIYPDSLEAGTRTGQRKGIYANYGLIQGHLLNAELGGKAIDCNLFPLTAEANRNHGGIEGEVKNIYRKIKPRERINYMVKGILDKDFFINREDYINNSRLLCSIETYENNEKNNSQRFHDSKP